MKQFMAFLVCLFMLSCDQQETKSDEFKSTKVDSLMSSYVANRNDKDSAVIMNTGGDDEIVVNDSSTNEQQRYNTGNWLEEASRYFVPLRLINWLRNRLFFSN